MTRKLTHEDVDAIERFWIEKSRKNFYAFRRYLRGNKFTTGWFIAELCVVLQQFYADLINGKKPVLVIQTPPQHGKSWTIIDFIVWLTGKQNHLKIIFASFSERLGHRCNAAIKRYFDSEKFSKIFPNATIPAIGDRSHSRTTEYIEYLDGEGVVTDGYFRNTTICGPVTGETLDVGIIDDPVKGREQANSKAWLDKIWDWYTNDFSTRFSEDAGLLIITTRWNIDDLVGRLKEKKGDAVKIVNFPAIATCDEVHRKEGDALFPELKSLAFLNDKKDTLAGSHWEALYQGNPTKEGGNLFKDHYWKFYTVLPKLKYRIIYGDTAQKAKEQNDWTVFAVWGISYDNKIFLLDLERERYESPQLIVAAKAFWNKHKSTIGQGVLRCIKIEDKSSGTGLIQHLRQDGIPVKGIPRNIDKVSRGNDTAPMIEVGNVYLPENAPWLSYFLSEHRVFPNGDFDDIVDTTMDAVEDLLINPLADNYEDLI